MDSAPRPSDSRPHGAYAPTSRTSRPRKVAGQQGFTLVELMVAVTILVILMLVVANFVGLVQRTWVRTNSNVSQFREARIAFDIMTRTISQATLNTYWQPDRAEVSKDRLNTAIFNASTFYRHSELQFVCGPAVGGAGAVFASGAATDLPGHAVFFQAPLGVTSLVATEETDTVANGENMVNLMCGRGYFVAWGDDEAFRPPFLTAKGVPVRKRLRLMEFSPTAEQNRIYDGELRPLVNDLGMPTANSKRWYREAHNVTGAVQSAQAMIAAEDENAGSRAFTRPVAENILTLVISPQMPTVGEVGKIPSRIAPSYAFDSLMWESPGASLDDSEFGPRGTQHVLPPVLKVTMVALDARSGERLSFDDSLRTSVVSGVNGLFTSAASYDEDMKTLADNLNSSRLDYRIFTTSIPLKQARWSK